jgi:hypothetical protein
VSPEVGPRSLGSLELSSGLLHGGNTLDLVWVTLALSLHVSSNIISSLLDITSDIEGVSRSLGDGKTVVESNATGNGTETTAND